MSNPSPSNTLPTDLSVATLVGRVHLPEQNGPSIVVIQDSKVIDITSKKIPTTRDLFELDDPAGYVATVVSKGTMIGSVEEISANSNEPVSASNKPSFLAPIDLQAVKAAGVTFVVSLLERVIEEKSRGIPEKLAEIREQITGLIGGDLSKLKPGSAQADALKESLIEQDMWSQYLEVGIGPDAEVFTKSQPMSSVGSGAHIGILPTSSWNNPEPEIVLVVNSRGDIVGATLGNDVNLRDMEGRSALLLGKAKDNNASCSIGPFVRLFDDNYSLDDVRSADVHLDISGEDGFHLDGVSSMSQISRDPTELVAATIGENHQYPDGFALFLGTMFVPVKDRDVVGEGFTHKAGDRVTVFSDKLGALTNVVHHCADCAPWNFGTSDLMRNLSKRGLL